jgi:hypothetical protein
MARHPGVLLYKESDDQPDCSSIFSISAEKNVRQGVGNE